MRYIKEFCIILMFLMLGSLVKRVIDLPIPEVIYGMIFLFIAMIFNLIKIEHVEDTTEFLSQILAFLFIPAGVGIINEFNSIKSEAVQIIVLITISTVITMVVTIKVVEILQRGKNDV